MNDRIFWLLISIAGVSIIRIAFSVFEIIQELFISLAVKTDMQIIVSVMANLILFLAWYATLIVFVAGLAILGCGIYVFLIGENYLGHQRLLNRIKLFKN